MTSRDGALRSTDPRTQILTSVYDAAGPAHGGVVACRVADHLRLRCHWPARSAQRLVRPHHHRLRCQGPLYPGRSAAGKRVSYVYDAADRRVYVGDPDGGRTTYTHDAANRLKRLAAPNVGRTTFSYDNAGRTLVRRPGGAGRVSHTYDAAGQLNVLATTNPTGGTINRFTYAYDPAGRRIQVSQWDGLRTTFAYDGAGELTGQRRTAGALPAFATFVYDPAGNRTLLIDSGMRTTTTYDAANEQLLDVTPTGRTTYLYDWPATAHNCRPRRPRPTTPGMPITA